MATIGYIRVSSDHQDLEGQKHLLWQYAHEHKMLIDEFIEVEVSSRKDTKTRRIDELLEKAQRCDTLIVAELSRLGRNMLETLNIINTLSEHGVQIIFIRQPELSTKGPQENLLLAIYSYFAETERTFISIRTKQGLAAAKERGVILGRQKGSKNKKSRRLDPFKDQIAELLTRGLTISSIQKMVNPELPEPLSYSSFKFFIAHDDLLKRIKNQAGSNP